MNDYLGYYVTDRGYQILGLDGWPTDPAEFVAELESEPKPAALDVPTIDVEPEMVRDTEIHREITS